MTGRRKQLILIAGPTAVGKTAAAIRVARHFKTAIISADSRQCYNELNIGVARPSDEELKAVPHYFIATHSIHDEVSAITFEEYAKKITEDLFSRHDVVVMTGGTGLYIKAFCEGLDEVPAVAPEIRADIINQYGQKGITWLSGELQALDPLFAEKGEMKNPQRMMRALEVVMATGESILNFQRGGRTQHFFDIKKIGLELPRTELISRIDKRVETMIEQGLENEVRRLLPFRHLNALQTVGYSEMFEYTDGKIAIEQAIEEIKIHTRQYAKRQMTWFKKDKSFQWFAPSEVGKLVDWLIC